MGWPGSFSEVHGPSANTEQQRNLAAHVVRLSPITLPDRPQRRISSRSSFSTVTSIFSRSSPVLNTPSFPHTVIHSTPTYIKYILQSVDALNPPIISHTTLPSLASSVLSSLSRPGEDFINRSLLDSLDAQADAEPVDSDAVSSLGSPLVPSPHMLQNHIGSPHIPESYHLMYNSILDSDSKQKSSFSAYRSPPFNAYNGNPRQPSNNYVPNYSLDVYPTHTDSHLPQGRFDTIEEAQAYVGIDQFGNTETGSMLLQSPTLQQYPQAPFGLTQMQSQTPYGPHLAGGAPPSASTMQNSTGTTQPAPQHEEISTIFVVGFPDDMQEREFQNMFTFSSGFEAATLKIPNKELTSYGSNPNAPPIRSAIYPQSFNANADPYNQITVNQGGVVVDNGRDGTTSSWPVPSEDPQYPSTMPQPPRKQIIGFAKFRSRQEALDARDILQGRRVDIEKGAVLKAEMAKKNLHTKRGPVAAGPTGLPTGVDAPPASAAPVEPMSARERELGTFAAMGFGSRRDRLSDDEDQDRRTAAMNSTRGARERAEEDERERERRRQEKDAERVRSAAFDAFHSVPAQPPRGPIQKPSGAVPVNGAVTQPSTQDSFGSGVWGMTAKETGSRKLVMPIHVEDLPRPTSPQTDQSSPPKSALYVRPSRSTDSEDSHHSNTALSPPSHAFSLPSSHNHPSLPHRPRPFSPIDPNQQYSMPSSSASSVDESGSDGELVKNVAGMTCSTDGSTSPQLPSPTSGGSGGTTGLGPRGNPGDQNPPINTLYVGNLPSSPPPPGFSPTYLEDELRELFGRRPGYRKLCFRQKNNGPMCFVEFEDVRHATKALHELHGHTLNGLVKSGGIRLSYSKNPLGVRTPTSATGTGLQQQQQPAYNVKELHSAPPSSAYFPPESFTRQLSQTEHNPRRDTMHGLSSYQYTTSPPAPRFVAATPSSATATSPHYTTSVAQIPNHGPATFPRSIQSQYGLDTVGSSAFSPFRISASSPHLERFGHALSPPPVNGIEASRAG